MREHNRSPIQTEQIDFQAFRERTLLGCLLGVVNSRVHHRSSLSISSLERIQLAAIGGLFPDYTV